MSSLLSYSEIKSKNTKNAEWIVLLHGLGGNSTLFHKQVKALSFDYNLLLIDFPGHGESESLNFKKYTPNHIAVKVQELLNHLNLKKIHLFAFSIGTIVANELITIDKERVQTAILSGPVLTFNKLKLSFIRFVIGIKHFLPYMTLYKVAAHIIMPKKAHAVSRGFFIKEAAKLGRREFSRWLYLLPISGQTFKKSLEKNKEVPILYVIGREDYLFINSAIEADNNNPNSELIIIDNCGHVCVLEKPKETNEYILNFLKK